MDLNLGAAANARMHFEKRKKHSQKVRQNSTQILMFCQEQRTHEANEIAIKAAEKKVKVSLNSSVFLTSFSVRAQEDKTERQYASSTQNTLV